MVVGKGVISRLRVTIGGLLGLVGLVAVTGVAVAFGVELSIALSLYLLTVVVAARAGGRLPAFATALLAPLVANYFLVEPTGTLRIQHEAA
jgi:K+-sensing histidine kinase KdpD